MNAANNAPPQATEAEGQRDCTHPVCSLKWGGCATAGGRTGMFTDCPAQNPTDQGETR